MTTALIVAGILALHFLTGGLFGRWKLKEYLNLTPTEDLPCYRRFWRRLLFPIHSGESWASTFDDGTYMSLGANGPVSILWNCDDGDSRSSEFRNQVGQKQRKAIQNYQMYSIILGGLFNLLPLAIGLVESLLLGIVALFSSIPNINYLSDPKLSKNGGDDRLSGLRKYRDQNIAAQQKRLEELSSITLVGIKAIEKLVQSWQAHIKKIEIDKIDIGAERLKALVEKIEVLLAEKRTDLAKISQALNDLDSKRQELEGFIRTLELYYETSALIPDLNGAGRPISDQIRENMVAADEAVSFCRRFSEMELEIGCRLQLTPETLAKGWTEGLEREDEIISKRNKISE